MPLPLVCDQFESFQPYVPGKPISETERELGISGVVKLASNENPLGPSPKAIEALRDAVGSVNDYPDGGAFYLKARLAQHLRVQPDQLIVGNGTNEIIELLVRTTMREGENLVYSTSSFIVYKLCALAAAREVREIPMVEHHFDLPSMAAAMDERTKLVFVANPNNPTGTYVTKSELDEFLGSIPEHVLVVLDEAYFEYVEASDCPNGLDYLSQRERLLVMRTFSKCYGLAGLRVGYGVGQSDLIEYLNRCRQPFNCNSLAQVAAIAAVDDPEHVQRSVQNNRQEMTSLVPTLESLGLSVVPSQANFVLVNFHTDAQAMFGLLLRQGVIVRPMGGYGLPTCARITIGTPKQNEVLLQALRAVMEAA